MKQYNISFEGKVKKRNIKVDAGLKALYGEVMKTFPDAGQKICLKYSVNESESNPLADDNDFRKMISQPKIPKVFVFKKEQIQLACKQCGKTENQLIDDLCMACIQLQQQKARQEIERGRQLKQNQAKKEQVKVDYRPFFKALTGQVFELQEGNPYQPLTAQDIESQSPVFKEQITSLNSQFESVFNDNLSTWYQEFKSKSKQAEKQKI